MFYNIFQPKYQKLFISLSAHIDRGVPIWGNVAGCSNRGALCSAKRHIKSVYPTLVLDGSKSGSFNITVKDESTIGAFGYDYHVRVCIIVFSNCHIIRREAPRCSFYCDGHMPEPRFVGRVTDTDSHAFFCNLLDCESSNTHHYHSPPHEKALFCINNDLAINAEPLANLCISK